MNNITTALYQAMLTRISIMPTESVKADYDARGWAISEGATIYRFNADGLGEDIDSFVQPMATKNMWNVAQHFYALVLAQFGGDEVSLNQALFNN